MRIFTRIGLLVFIASAAMAAAAQTANEQVRSKLFDAAQMLSDVQILSADDMEGRSADRPVMQKARRHLEKRFAESGLQPFADSFRQEFEIKQRGVAASLSGV